MTWYTRVILPCSCPNMVGFADFSHFRLAGCLAPVGPWAAGHARSVGTRLLRFNTLFLCGFLQVCSTTLHWPSLKVLGLKVLFFLSGWVLCLEQSPGGHGTELGSHSPQHTVLFRIPLCMVAAVG